MSELFVIYRVLTEHVGDENVTEFGEDGPSDAWIYQRDMDWIAQSDVVIAKLSTPSLGVGYEIGKAEDMKKKKYYVFTGINRIKDYLPGGTEIQISTLSDTKHSQMPSRILIISLHYGQI